MDRNFRNSFRSPAEKEEINAAVKGEPILIQAKRITKRNSIPPHTNSQQIRTRNVNVLQDQQISVPTPTVAHQIKIIKLKPSNRDSRAKHPASCVDKLFETNAYKSATAAEGNFSHRKQDWQKRYNSISGRQKSERPLHPRKYFKGEGASELTHRPIKSYNNARNSIKSEDDLDININYIPRFKNKIIKRAKPIDRQIEVHSQTEEVEKSINTAEYSGFEFLLAQNLKYSQRVKKISQFSEETSKRTQRELPLPIVPMDKLKKIKQVPSFPMGNSKIVSYKKNLSPVAVKRGPKENSRRKSNDNSSNWKRQSFPSVRKQSLKQKIEKKKQNPSRNKNDFRQEPYRKVPPSSPAKAPSKLKNFSKKSKKSHLTEDKSDYKPPRPSLLAKIRNWRNAKILEAEIKRLIVFREKNKWSILSDSEISTGQNSDFSQYGDEWLAYTASDTSFDQDVVEQETQRTNTNFPEESHQLYRSLNPFFKTLKLFGRLPIVIEKENGEIKCKMKWKSCNYLCFCITTILLTIITGILAMGFADMQRPHSLHNVNQKRDQLIVEKYWIAGLITFLNNLYVLLWSYSVLFHNGLYLEEYLTRWHCALATIKYSLDASARKFIFWNQVFLALYCIISTIVFFFGKQYCSLFWGNGELIAMLLFKRFIQNPRSHQYFFWMRICGHFIYLYSVLCSRMITLLMLIHCKLSEMISRRWNLRLGCVLEKVAVVQAGVDSFTIKTRVIPYAKLFVEHLIVTSLSIHTGNVFAIVGLSYYAFKGIIMFLTLYVLVTYYLLSIYSQSNPEIVKTETETIAFFPRGKDLRILTDILIMAQSWIGFLITSEAICKVGSVIMNGYDFVRRHGMILCRTSSERRFILSMQFAFTPMYNYYINFGFKVDRVFIYKFVSVVFGFCMLVAFFSPIRWKTENMRQCKNETCVDLSFPRLFQRDILKRMEQ